MVWDQMKTIYDPEIPVNIVDLGLIYSCEIAPTDEGGKKIDIKMSLTAPGCGMGNVLKVDVESKLAALPEVNFFHFGECGQLAFHINFKHVAHAAFLGGHRHLDINFLPAFIVR